MPAEGREIVALGELCTSISVRAGEGGHEVLSVTKHRGIIRAEDYFDQRVASRDLTNYKLVESGQFAYSTIHIDEGAVARNKLPMAGVVSPMYTVFEAKRPDLVLPEYLDYLLRAPALLAIYKSRAGGSVRRRRSLPFAAFAAIEVALPGFDEQHRILDLIHTLDDVGRRYEQCERAASRLLDAERARLIDEADHPILMVDDILDGIKGGKSPVCRERIPTLDEWGVLKISAVQPFGFEREEAKLLPADVEPFQDARVRERDVLITRSNTPGRVGLACYVDYDPGRLLMSDLIWRLSPKEAQVRPPYLAEALMSPRARTAIRATASGTSGSMKKINRTKLRRLAVTVPELAEQDRIVAHLDDVRRGYAGSRSARAAFAAARVAVINNLLAGHDSVPVSYERFLTPSRSPVAA